MINELNADSADSVSFALRAEAVETAWAEDGSLEGLEDPARRFAVGVLWHPEMEDDKRLFEALVGEARRYRAERMAAAERTA